MKDDHIYSSTNQTEELVREVHLPPYMRSLFAATLWWQFRVDSENSMFEGGQYGETVRLASSQLGGNQS